MKKCLIVDKMHESIMHELKRINYEADYRPEIEREEIKKVIGNYSGLIVRSKTTVDDDLVEDKGALQFIARAGAGIDQLDIDALAKRNIAVLNAPEGNKDALGEHAVGLLLSLFNKINVADAEVRNWKWLREKNRGYELQGKTVGIVGYGNMGSSFAKKLSGFDCRVIAFDKYRSYPLDQYAEGVSEEVLFNETDILSIHIPLNQENHFLIEDNYLNSFRKSIFLINTARGQVLSLLALVNFMKSGKVLGAGLDVLQNENLERMNKEEKESFEYLVRSERTVLTPHVAGWSYESYQKINRVLCEKIAALQLI